MSKPTKTFKSFNELLEAAVRYRSIEKPESEDVWFYERQWYENGFRTWLENYKGWNNEDEEGFIEHLTVQNWVEFLEYENNLSLEKENTALKEKEEFEAETVLWVPAHKKKAAPKEQHNGKPVFKPEVIPDIYELIKSFFSPEHQPVFKHLLQSGGIAATHLHFLDNGNRLADAFKQLIKTDFITGCSQKELETWISANFTYTYRNEVKKFSPRYLNDIISSNSDRCQNPILNVTREKSTGSFVISKV